MMEKNSRPTPWPDWMPLKRSATMTPTSAADMAVYMNRMTLLRDPGTPTARAAVASPPTAKIQFPNVVWVSTHVATIVTAIHHSTASWKLYGARNVLPKIDCAPANPGAWSEMSNRTVLVRNLVTPTSTPRRTKNVASVITTRNPLIAPMIPAKTRTAMMATHTLTA